MDKVRIAVAALTLSAAGFVAIIDREGYSDAPIVPVPGDPLTIGFGTTTHPDGSPIRPTDRITPPRAVARAMQDVQAFEGALKQCVKVPLSQAEYDLYLSMSYNVGSGAFCRSSIVRALNEERYADACNHILDWKFVRGFDCSTPGNRVCPGLWRDRLELHAKCVAAQ